MKLFDLLIIILAAMFFFAVFTAIGKLQDRKAMAEIERMEFEDAALQIQYIRNSEIMGWNIRNNREL